MRRPALPKGRVFWTFLYTPDVKDDDRCVFDEEKAHFLCAAGGVVSRIAVRFS